MLLIIVGAGATFDSDWRRQIVKSRFVDRDATSPTTGSRPPLAKSLFGERFGRYVARFPPSQGLMVRLRKAGDSVEEELERIRGESASQEHLPRQLMAVRYYIRELVAEVVENWVGEAPDRITNFTQLVGGLEPWRQHSRESVAIVTFNYDTLFDEALTNLLPRFRIEQVENCVADERYQLFKLHGSVNWWREVRAEWIDPLRAGRTSGTGWATTMCDPPGEFTEDGIFHVSDGMYPPCVPCIAIPMATKSDSDFVCPPDHIAKLKEALNEATDVLIIGWKGNERHFLELWRLVWATKKDPHIGTIGIVDVSVAAGQEIVAKVTHHVGLAPRRDRYYETFSTFVNEKLNEYLDILPGK